MKASFRSFFTFFHVSPGFKGSRGKPLAGDKKSKEWEKLVKQLVDDASPYGAASKHYIHDVIDPRKYILNALEISHNIRSKGISEHKLANWPTKF